MKSKSRRLIAAVTPRIVAHLVVGDVDDNSVCYLSFGSCDCDAAIVAD